MSENTDIKEFALGAGAVYIKRGSASEEELESSACRIGETDECTLRYECKTKELLDVEGNLAAIMRFGEKVRIAGVLSRIFPASMGGIIPRGTGDGSADKVSVLLVCPLPGGESFRLHLKGASPTGTVFDVKPGGKAKFEITCGMGENSPRFCLADGSSFPEGGVAR